MTRNYTRRDKQSVFIDVGHSRLRLLAPSQTGEEAEAFQVDCQGLTKGKITDASLFADSIRRLIESAELPVAQIRAIISIPNLHTRIVRRNLQHKCGGTYRSADYTNLHDAIIDSVTSELDEVIDVYLSQVWLDEKPIDPLSFGQSGRELRAQALIATHPKILLADILSCMNACGLEVSEFRSGYFGLARAVTALRPGVENAVLIDHGHSTTSGVMAIGGSIQQVFTVAAGSQHITKDLMAGLGVSFEESEALKKLHGVSFDGQQAANLAKFIRPRVAEIFALSQKNFALYAKALDGGLLFCGNGSHLPGLASFAEKSLGIHAPFICNLSTKSASSFLDAKVSPKSTAIDSGWLSILAHARFRQEEEAVRRFERDSRPLAKLRPLWTWLSELSR